MQHLHVAALAAHCVRERQPMRLASEAPRERKVKTISARDQSHCALQERSVRELSRETNMSWKVEVVMDDSGEWEGDPQRFASEQEALAYARDLEFRCSAIREKRIVRSDDPVNQRWSSRGVRAARTTRS